MTSTLAWVTLIRCDSSFWRRRSAYFFSHAVVRTAMPAARVARQAPAEIRVRAVRAAQAAQVALGGPAVRRAKVARADKAAWLAWVAALGHCLI